MSRTRGIAARWAVLAVVAGAISCANSRQPRPPAREVPLEVSNPVHLAYDFPAGQVNRYYLRQVAELPSGAEPVDTTITQRVLHPSTTVPDAAAVSYSFAASEPVAQTKDLVRRDEITLVVDQERDGAIANLRMPDGTSSDERDFGTEELGRIADIAATAILVSPDHFYSLALPDHPVGLGDTWTAEVSQTPPDTGEPDLWSYRYTVAGFAKWNDHDCAKIDAVVTEPTPEDAARPTFYFDHRNGLLVGAVIATPGRPEDVLWLAAPQDAD